MKKANDISDIHNKVFKLDMYAPVTVFVRNISP